MGGSVIMPNEGEADGLGADAPLNAVHWPTVAGWIIGLVVGLDPGFGALELENEA